MSFMRRLRERWSVYRDRKKRLNASRYIGGTQGNFKTDLDVDAHISRRDYPGGKR
jgi:hypothetical protein